MIMAALVIVRPLWKLGFHDGSCLHQPLNPPVHLTSTSSTSTSSAFKTALKHQPTLSTVKISRISRVSLTSTCFLRITLLFLSIQYALIFHTPRSPLIAEALLTAEYEGVFQFCGFCSDGLTFSCSASPQCSPSSAFTPGYWLPHRGYIQLSLATFMESHRFYAKTVLNYLTRESYPLQNG